jgi:hypothetical protein
MLVFSSPKGASIRCEWGDKVIVAFPEKAEKADALITLAAKPEEEPQEGVISWPGEYDIQEIAIRGIGQNDGGLVSYSLEMEGVRVAFLPAPLQEWKDHELELLGDIDILILPSNNAKLVQKLVDEIDPRILIPVPNGDKEVYAEILNACGAKNQEPVSEFKAKGMPAEGREVVVLAS